MKKIGESQWARFRFEDGRLIVGILTMYKEGEDVIRSDLLHSSCVLVLDRDLIRISPTFLTFLIISDWCLSALITNCD